MERKQEAESLQAEDRKIELLLQEAFDYSDEQLLKELEMAEAQVRSAGREGQEIQSGVQERTDVPDEMDPQAPVGEFETILAKMEERGIKPQLEKELDGPELPDFSGPESRIYPTEISEPERPPESPRIRRCYRAVWRALFAAILAGGVLLAAGVDVGGRNALEYEADVRGGSGSNIAWNNDGENYAEVDSEEEAYQVIEERLGIPVLKLGYRPEGMVLKKVALEDTFAIISFGSSENTLFLKQAIGADTNSDGIKSDRKKWKEIYNEWLDMTAVIEKEPSKEGYSTIFKYDKRYYYLEGVVEGDTFEQIVKDLRF